jgi:hypothetical protein
MQAPSPTLASQGEIRLMVCQVAIEELQHRRGLLDV